MRRMAPTLWGSESWSSTSTIRRRPSIGLLQHLVQVAGLAAARLPGPRPDAPRRGAAAGQWPRHRRFRPEPGQKLGTDGFGGPGGQDRPAQLAAGIGQGGLDRMKAIKPVWRRGLAVAAVRGLGRPRGFFSGFPRFFGGFRAAVFAEGFGSHGGLIKKWGLPGKGRQAARAKSQPFPRETGLDTPAPLTNNPRSAAKPFWRHYFRSSARIRARLCAGR